MGTDRRRAALPTGLVLAASVSLALSRSAGAQGMGLEEAREMMSWGTTGLILVEELEYGVGSEGRPVELESLGYYGGAFDRLWFRLEGEQLTTRADGYAEGHLYYGRLVSPFWDALVGARADGRWGGGGDARAHLALGLIGLAPLRFELSPTLFVSHEGDVSFRLRAEYDILVTQRLIFSPDCEVNAAVQEAPAWGVGSGVNDLQIELRLRYDIVRELSPYLGFVWRRRLGATAQLARDEGEAVSETAIVLGVRAWR